MKRYEKYKIDYKDALKNITKSCCDICKDDKGNILIQRINLFL